MKPLHIGIKLWSQGVTLGIGYDLVRGAALYFGVIKGVAPSALLA
jgi:hypothetical protein